MKVLRMKARKPYQTCCDGCHSLLEIEYEDIKVYDTPRCHYRYVNCPICHLAIRIEDIDKNFPVYEKDVNITYGK